jgi:hypothetical protein
VALSEEDKNKGCFTRVDALEWTENTAVQGWVKGHSFLIKNSLAST